MKHINCLLFLIVMNASVQAQNKSVIPYYFDDPIVTDSSSTIIIPTQYSADFFSSNKITLNGDYYANIIFYNSLNDSSKKLFETNTFIMSFHQYKYFYNQQDPKFKPKNITSEWIIYMVRNHDRNLNGKIDNNDPTILFVSDIHGDSLKMITSQDENVVDFNVFEDQNMALIKIQRDLDNNGEFEFRDKSYYMVKLDLTTLTLGKKIEIK